MKELHDLTGRRFGRLLVKHYVGAHDNRYFWHCECDCGRTKNIRANSLRRGRTQSCGCLQKERSRAYNETDCTGAQFRGKRSRTYQSYIGARARCIYPANDAYAYYGGRGIEFRFESFQDFLNELGERPAGKSIDRIDTNGHYERGNVRWATPKEQANNRRNNLPKY